MEDLIRTHAQALSKEVTEGGKTVTIVVDCMGKNLWQLSIHGKNNHFTTWSDWFPTANEAMNRGLAAILSEGIDEFYSYKELSFFD